MALLRLCKGSQSRMARYMGPANMAAGGLTCKLHSRPDRNLRLGLLSWYTGCLLRSVEQEATTRLG